MVAAINLLNLRARSKVEWQGRGKDQEYFLNKILPTCENDIGANTIGGITAIASQKQEDINAFLAKAGSKNRFASAIGPDWMGFFTSLKLELNWIYQMRRTGIRTENGTFEGLKIAGNHVKFFRSTYKGVDYAIARVQSVSVGNTFIATPAEDLGIGLIEATDKIFWNMEPDDRFGGLQFPAIDLDQVSAVNWLEGMEASWGITRVRVSPFYQHMKLRITDRGACKSESVTQEKPDLVIEKPFLLWTAGYSIKMPLVAAYLDWDSWIPKA